MKEQQETYKLGGKWYRAISVPRTLEHDHFLAGHTRQAGAADWALREGESHEAFGARILGDMMASGRSFLILGGLLIPCDVEEWTAEVAAKTAHDLSRLTDPEEKKVANAALLGVVLDFFVSGLASWMISGTSSEAVGESGANGEAASSESGATLSA